MVQDTRVQNRFLSYWLPLIVWICGIFYLSSIPISSFKRYPPYSWHEFPWFLDPAHIIAFFILFLLFYQLLSSKKGKVKNIQLFSFVFTITVSFSKECWQIFIPTRSFNLKHILVDLGATFLAMFVVLAINGAARNLKSQK